MDAHYNEQGFRLPESFLTQLGEYTRGYILLGCNEAGDLYVHEAYDNAVIKMGLINYADMHVSAALTHMHNMALKEEEYIEKIQDALDNASENNQDDEDDDSDDEDYKRS
jgi:hypothetical protein